MIEEAEPACAQQLLFLVCKGVDYWMHREHPNWVTDRILDAYVDGVACRAETVCVRFVNQPESRDRLTPPSRNINVTRKLVDFGGMRCEIIAMRRFRPCWVAQSVIDSEDRQER
jgi:hypothetical protein